MSDEELQAFVKDFENGALAPPVDPADIRRMWEFTCKARKNMTPAVLTSVFGQSGFLLVFLKQPLDQCGSARVCSMNSYNRAC